MVTFTLIDTIVLSLFVGLILALGFSARLRDNSFFQYFAAGRNLSLVPFVSTLVCTWYGGILGLAESVSYFGLGTWLLFGVPYYVFAAIYAQKVARKVREIDDISIPERIARQFGKGSGVFSAVLIFLLAVPSAHVLMLAVLLQSVVPLQLLPALLIVGGAGTLFLYRGGLLADVRMSLAAFVMMYVGFGVIVASHVVQFPPAQAFESLRGTPMLTLTGGQGWLAIISYFILGAWTLVDPGFHQRVACAKDPETSQKGVWVSILCWMTFDLLSISAGMYALQTLKSPPSNPLMIFPALAQQNLSPGLKSIFFCGMLGTILSAMVGYTLVAGGTFGREIMGRIMPVADDRLKFWTRIGLTLAILIAIVVALFVDSVVAIWYSWSGVVVGAVLLPFLISMGSKANHLRRESVLWSMVLSFITSLSWWIIGTANGNKFLTFNQGGQDIPVGTLLPGLFVSGLVILIWPKLSGTENE